MSEADVHRRSTGVRLLLVVSAALTLGSLLLAVAHTGLRVPVLDLLGPRGSAVPVAAVGFAVAALLHAAALLGLATRRAWGWALGLLVHGLTLAAAAASFRGAGSALGIALAGLALGQLVSPRVRRELLSR